MRPIRTERSNFTFVGPSPEIADLPSRREDGATLSVWQPSRTDRDNLAAGAQVQLIVFGDAHPPVSVTVVAEHEILGPDDLRCSGCQALYTRGRHLEFCGQCGGSLVHA